MMGGLGVDRATTLGNSERNRAACMVGNEEWEGTREGGSDEVNEGKGTPPARIREPFTLDDITSARHPPAGATPPRSRSCRRR